MQPAGLKRTLLLITVIGAAIMELIDTSIVNVALSQMSGNLGATLEDTSWVVTSYAIANVIIIPITSFLAARLGRRNYYIGSVIAFTVFSVLCGNATNIWMLVIFRFLQGIGGGALLSVSQAIVFEAFPREQQNMAGSLFAIGVFIGPTIGPTLGGYITEHYSWPWIFYINLPIGVVVTVLSLLLVKEPVVKPQARNMDWWGILLLVIGVASLQTVLERGEREDWFETKYITYLTVTAILGILLFIWWELKTAHPVVNLRVLKSRNMIIAATLTFLTGAGLFTSVFITPVMAQRIMHFPPTTTGLLLLPGAIIAIFALILSATLIKKGVPPMAIVVAGFLLFILFNRQMASLNQDAGVTDFSLPLILRAVSIAWLTAPLTTMAVATLDPVDVPQGAALNNMMRQLGGSFGLAMINTYIAQRFAQHRHDLVINITDFNIASRDRLEQLTGYFISKGWTPAEAGSKALAVVDGSINRQSSLLSYLDAYQLLGWCFILSLPLLLFVVRRRKAPAAKAA